MINTEIGNARITLAFFYDEAERVSFNGAGKDSIRYGRQRFPGEWQTIFRSGVLLPGKRGFVLPSNVFLNDVIVGLCTFPGFQGQCFSCFRWFGPEVF